MSEIHTFGSSQHNFNNSCLFQKFGRCTNENCLRNHNVFPLTKRESEYRTVIKKANYCIQYYFTGKCGHLKKNDKYHVIKDENVNSGKFHMILKQKKKNDLKNLLLSDPLSQQTPVRSPKILQKPQEIEKKETTSEKSGNTRQTKKEKKDRKKLRFIEMRRSSIMQIVQKQKDEIERLRNEIERLHKLDMENYMQKYQKYQPYPPNSGLNVSPTERQLACDDQELKYCNWDDDDEESDIVGVSSNPICNDSNFNYAQDHDDDDDWLYNYKQDVTPDFDDFF